jgi:transposase-like protein
MTRKHPKAYPPEFRQKVVELARAGRHRDDLAHEFGLARQTVRNWIKQHELNRIALRLNQRPRKTLHYETPESKLSEMLR